MGFVGIETSGVAGGLRRLAEDAVALAPDGLLTQPFDPDWRSECEVHSTSATSFWRPVAQRPRVDFRGIEHALEMPLHRDLVAYYSTFWSGTLEADCKEGVIELEDTGAVYYYEEVSLIQLWNPDDFERLRANLLGHAVTKFRQRQPLTVFFATTEPDGERFLSVDNASGEVVLEEPGSPPLATVAASLAAFLARLRASARPSDLY